MYYTAGQGTCPPLLGNNYEIMQYYGWGIVLTLLFIQKNTPDCDSGGVSIFVFIRCFLF